MSDSPLHEGDRLALLYRISQAFNSSLDLNEVLDTVIDEVIAATRAERGFLMLRDSAGQLTCRIARGLDRNNIDQPDSQVSKGVIEQVARDGQPLIASNAQDDFRLSERRSVVYLGLRSVLCVPLRHKDVLLGVVYVDNRIQAGIFTSADLELLTSIASSAAVAIENARLYQLAVEKGRIERELQMASDVQVSLLPHAPPKLSGWEFSAWWEPAHQVGGDFFDFLNLNNGSWGMLVADVADKGLAAALFMATSRSILRASLSQASSPAEGINLANRLICADSTRSMFVTLFYAQVSPRDEVVYVNAGHYPTLHFHAADGCITRLTRTAMALGVLEDTLIEQGSVNLEPGDLLLFYTDGVTDTMNEQDEMFGDQRLLDVLAGQRGRTASQVTSAIQKALALFRGQALAFDDVTLVIARRV